ncbi:hypothetical protein HZC21_03025 [Candidatus Peregrinibacteria bacterium]|nr:hypothetical protein [Candidatus Peregrinibacteria bacterium]
MAVTFISKRVLFPKGGQQKFLNKSKKRLDFTMSQFAKFLNINVRTLTDWKREKFLMPLSAVNFLKKKTGINPPRNIYIRNKFEDVKRAGYLGGIAVYKKYGKIGGSQIYRKTQWEKWWQTTGRFIPHPITERKKVKIPRKSALLAEFVGIMIGDGGITKHQITIALHRYDDYFYSVFLKKMIKKLFGLFPSEILNDNVRRLYISRTNLVNFCKRIGLKIGNKINQNVDIPSWIYRNKSFEKACLRGLVDTDGCIGIHRYFSKRDQYCYKKIIFTSASPFLIKSVMKIMEKFGFHPRKDREGRKVWLDCSDEVKEYMYTIKTNNPKHRKRFLERYPSGCKGRVC